METAVPMARAGSVTLLLIPRPLWDWPMPQSLPEYLFFEELGNKIGRALKMA
jgi:hypothetical protein